MNPGFPRIHSASFFLLYSNEPQCKCCLFCLNNHTKNYRSYLFWIFQLSHIERSLHQSGAKTPARIIMTAWSHSALNCTLSQNRMSYSKIQLKHLFFSTDTKLPHGTWWTTCLLKLHLSLSLPSVKAFSAVSEVETNLQIFIHHGHVQVPPFWLPSASNFVLSFIFSLPSLWLVGFFQIQII